jgi:hypothetical protein
VNLEVSPWSGLLRPATGPVPMGNWTDAGLLVPDLSVTAGHLGLIQTGVSSPWFNEHVKQYLTSADYFAPLVAVGLPADPSSLINSLLLLHSREVYPFCPDGSQSRSWPRSTVAGSWPGCPRRWRTT